MMYEGETPARKCGKGSPLQAVLLTSYPFFRQTLVDALWFCMEIEVKWYEYAFQCIEELERVRPDVLLLDDPPAGAMQLHTLLQHLHSRPLLAQIPLVLLDVENEPVYEMPADKWLWLRKPFTLSQLIQGLTCLLQTKDAGKR